MAFIDFVHLWDHRKRLEVTAGLKVLPERRDDSTSCAESLTSCEVR
jgi:hypothetical protein